jgi:type IV pilus assembly protein PilM
LTIDPKTEDVRIVDATLIRAPGNCAPSAADMAEFHKQAITTLFERAKFEGSVVCVSFPAQKTITRLFDLPPVEVKRIPEIMQYEVKQQIPLPLEVVAWDHQILDPRPGTDDPSNIHPAIVVAAKLDDVQDQLAPLIQCGIKADIVQSDCIAMFNLVSYDRCPFDQVPDQRRNHTAVIALLDIGASSSNLVVTNGHTFLARGIPLAGNDFYARWQGS